MQMLLKAEIILIFKKYFLPFRLFNNSLISSSRYQSFTNILFRPQQSTQKQRPPPSFLINSTREAIGNKLGQIKPFFKFLISYSLRALSLSQDIGYSRLNRGTLPPRRQILQLYRQCSRSLSASFSKNISTKSLISSSSSSSIASRLGKSSRDRYQLISLIVTVNILQFLQ